MIFASRVSDPAVAADETRQASITDRSVQWPTAGQWRRLLLLEDYNTRVVLLGATMLGFAGGAVGSFALLRGRALMGDALSHAAVPGIGLVFLAVTMAGGDAKSFVLLLAGATCSSLLGLAVILFLRNATRIKEDAALGIVLSVFFGAGAAALGIAQQTTGHAAGLEGFIYGKTASMVASDALLIAGAGLTVTVLCLLLFKEFKLLCFDEGFAASRGYSILLLDIALMGLVVAVTIVGLQAVGAILMIAMLVVPACAARFWTERMGLMTLLSAIIGAASALVGAGMSALLPRLPSGAIIVLVASVAFVVSMLGAPARGILARAMRRRRLNAKVHRQHLLRAVYEWLESHGQAPRRGQHDESDQVPIAELLPMRSWSQGELRSYVARAESRGLLRTGPGNLLRLSPLGCEEAAANVHNHRMWELYLIHFADVAASRVDRDADAIEHVLDPTILAELESLVHEGAAARVVPTSPHPMPHAGET
ncbi:MAG: iron ABC transporter [Planctomycetota bacterium]|nr:MAG: iron ABC transporter [Planctomycetota bacterium]